MLVKSKTILALTASGIYGFCMCLLFFASSLHHTVKRPASIQARLPAYLREIEGEGEAENEGEREG
jgi:predicted membrane channel-forming protein YqfA (hemolysin III family)